MASIVVMEDDAGTRMLVSSVLTKEGHRVAAAADGAAGLALVQSLRPDLVVSDVHMPGMNGFEMLAALRAKPEFAALPVILLTSLQERVHMRIGMTTGADDYITKPFRPGELREAVDAQLRKRENQLAMQRMVTDTAVREALEEQTQKLARLYEHRLAKALSDRWPTATEASAEDERFADATVLFVDIPAFPLLAQALDAAELTALVKRFYGSAGDTVYLFGAHYMQFIGEGLLAVFVDTADTESVSHSLRAARAALGLADAARNMTRHLHTISAGRRRPGVLLTNTPPRGGRQEAVGGGGGFKKRRGGGGGGGARGPPPPPRRAAGAGGGGAPAAPNMPPHLHTLRAGRRLPDFDVAMALHHGPVTIARLQDPLHDAAGQVLPVGETTVTTMQLQRQAQAMGWAIAASASTLRAMTGAVRTDRRALVQLPGRSAPLDAVELVGLAY
jgi:DNA-binding response OmpR family regulator